MLWAIRGLQKRTAPNVASDPRIDEYFGLAKAFKATFSQECRPHFVGVWDTVSSVGWFSHPMTLPYTANNPDIAIGRHAVAIDERRAFFRTNLWRLPTPAVTPTVATQETLVAWGPVNLKQVWFPGVHCDVGGGYPEPESSLAKIALKWMFDEARPAHLLLDEEKVALVLGERGEGYVRPDPDGRMHDSLTLGWRFLEHVPKPHWDGKQTMWQANKSRRRTWPPVPVVHDAAYERAQGKYAECLPPDAVRLSEWEKAPPTDAGR
jgi:uncharacterized protein (DUF2235 family)